MEIGGKSFIVTGGASGLGAAVAAGLAGKGANVLIADVQAPDEASLSESVVWHETDVTMEADGSAAVKATIDAFGTLHGLVNCAGIAPGEKLLGRKGLHRLETFARTIAINVTGTFNMMRLAVEKIVENDPGLDGERGVIVNTASIAAYEGQIGQCAYAASKGAVASMTLPAARELAGHGVRVVALAPGLFKTPMVAGLPEDVQESLGAAVPFPVRLGDPAEFWSIVHHIIGNRMLNGEVIRIDGALRMAPK